VSDEIKVVATNKSARHDYFIDDVFEAGLSLTGTEVKSLRQGRANIGDGYIYIDALEAWAENIHIPEYSQGTWTNHAVRRKRKLLLHHHEINELLIRTREKGHTIVPLRLYFKGSRAKLEIGLARGKKLYDKRQTLRERQDNLEAQRAMSLKNHPRD